MTHYRRPKDREELIKFFQALGTHVDFKKEGFYICILISDRWRVTPFTRYSEQTLEGWGKVYDYYSHHSGEKDDYDR